MNNELATFFGGRETSLVNGNCIEVMNQIPELRIYSLVAERDTT